MINMSNLFDKKKKIIKQFRGVINMNKYSTIKPKFQLNKHQILIPNANYFVEYFIK